MCVSVRVCMPFYVCAPPHLEAVVLSEDGAVNRFDEHLVLHAEVHGLHSTTGAEQRLVAARLLQPRHQIRTGESGMGRG